MHNTDLSLGKSRKADDGGGDSDSRTDDAHRSATGLLLSTTPYRRTAERQLRKRRSLKTQPDRCSWHRKSAVRSRCPTVEWGLSAISILTAVMDGGDGGPPAQEARQPTNHAASLANVENKAYFNLALRGAPSIDNVCRKVSVQQSPELSTHLLRSDLTDIEHTSKSRPFGFWDAALLSTVAAFPPFPPANASSPMLMLSIAWKSLHDWSCEVINYMEAADYAGLMLRDIKR